MSGVDTAVARGMLTAKEVSAQLGVTVGALAQMRYLGTGPTFIKLGSKTVRYRQADIDEFVSAGVRTSTSGAA